MRSANFQGATISFLEESAEILKINPEPALIGSFEHKMKSSHFLEYPIELIGTHT